MKRSVPAQRFEKAKRRSRSAAFTLIEIMIAMTIFMVVLYAIYSSWSAILRGSKVGLEAAAEAQRTRMALRSLEESLMSVQFFPQNGGLYSILADTSGDYGSISFVSRLSSAFPGSGPFRGQSVRRIAFEVRPGLESVPQLVLIQKPLLEPPEATGEPYAIPLLPNVERFQLEFFNIQTMDWEPEWLYTNQIPKLVRVTLGIKQTSERGSAPPRMFTRVIALATSPITSPFGAPPIR